MPDLLLFCSSAYKHIPIYIITVEEYTVTGSVRSTVNEQDIVNIYEYHYYVHLLMSHWFCKNLTLFFLTC